LFRPRFEPNAIGAARKGALLRQAECAFILRVFLCLLGLRVLAVPERGAGLGMTTEGVGQRHVPVLAEGEESGLLIRLRTIGERESLGAGCAHPDHQAAMFGVAVAVWLAGRLEQADETIGEFDLHGAVPVLC